jgi:hypothetical protein
MDQPLFPSLVIDATAYGIAFDDVIFEKGKGGILNHTS